jgi:hypothetical protein
MRFALSNIYLRLGPPTGEIGVVYGFLFGACPCCDAVTDELLPDSPLLCRNPEISLSCHPMRGQIYSVPTRPCCQSLGAVCNRVGWIGDRRMTRCRVYWITSVLATLMYLLVLFSLWVSVPVGSEREWLLVLLACLVLLAIPLVFGAWEYRRKNAFVRTGRSAQGMGIIVLLEFALCLIQISNLLFLIHRHPSLANHVP